MIKKKLEGGSDYRYAHIVGSNSNGWNWLLSQEPYFQSFVRVDYNKKPYDKNAYSGFCIEIFQYGDASFKVWSSSWLLSHQCNLTWFGSTCL